MEEELDAKLFSNKELVASEILAKMACELCEIVATAGGGTGFLKIYDGVDNNAERKLTIKVFQNQSRQIGFHHHVYFSKGLYVEFVDQLDYVFVQWLERPQGIGHSEEE